MKWINVNDKLPKPGKDVLAYIGYHDEYGRVTIAYYDTNNNWYSTERPGQMVYISHWKPLPSRPRNTQ